MKTEHETQNFEHYKKMDEIMKKYEEEKVRYKKKYKEEIQDKTASLMKYKNFERYKIIFIWVWIWYLNFSKYEAEKQKNQSFKVQLKELEEQNNNLKMDLNMMKQEKLLNNEQKIKYS